MQVSDFAVKVLILTAVLALLPTSPFVGFLGLVDSVPFVSYLNWFLPISDILAILEVWLSTVAIFYSILFALNYVGILKS